MAQLTQEQFSFLQRHLDKSLDPYDVVFDATGMGPSVYIPIMKSLDKFVALGVTPCKKHGHTMRYKRVCLQCNTSCFHYKNKYRSKGYVYIAQSSSTHLYKIGCTHDIQDRENHLNSNFYAGLTDRKMLYFVKCNEAGKIEYTIQQRLKQYQYEIHYLYYGKNISCKELFQCDYALIKDTFDDVTNKL